jgi:hypothetical protein
MKKLLIAAAAVLVLCGATAAYLIVDHNNDVAHAKAQAKAAKAAREARIDAAHKKNVALWQDDEAKWQQEHDDYDECKSETADAFAAGDEVSGVISSGGSHDEFLEPTQDLGVAISGATRAVSGNYECLGVLLVLSKAHDKVGDGLNDWLEWMRGDAFLTADSPDDLGIDKDFSKAQDYLADADAALAALEPGTEPTKPERGKAYESPSDVTDLGDEDDDSLDS